MIKKLSIIYFSILLLITTNAYSADTISGKVIGISDGDTIKVLQDHAQYKIRLFGIDCPESHQDFGTKAKQFTSDMVFGKQVKVMQEDIDRYGRTVGTVTIDGECLNEGLVKAGYAWVYHQYCKKSICDQWKRYEETARNERIGLWSQANPTPPWDFRRGKKTSSEAEKTLKKPDANLIYHGNIKSKVFHKPNCKAYDCKNCTAVFYGMDRAIEAGYRPCGMCKP